ncbi:MAG: hypothetical protein NZ942_03645, partial [Candidatus Aenigmarchaeota archaeon]|nr:hypothetical protein [Candidatus Aenigmarchaeota archaeon]
MTDPITKTAAQKKTEPQPPIYDTGKRTASGEIVYSIGGMQVTAKTADEALAKWRAAGAPSPAVIITPLEEKAPQAKTYSERYVEKPEASKVAVWSPKTGKYEPVTPAQAEKIIVEELSKKDVIEEVSIVVKPKEATTTYQFWSGKRVSFIHKPQPG